jgi:hypothetical protein
MNEWQLQQQVLLQQDNNSKNNVKVNVINYNYFYLFRWSSKTFFSAFWS